MSPAASPFTDESCGQVSAAFWWVPQSCRGSAGQACLEVVVGQLTRSVQWFWWVTQSWSGSADLVYLAVLLGHSVLQWVSWPGLFSGSGGSLSPAVGQLTWSVQRFWWVTQSCSGSADLVCSAVLVGHSVLQWVSRPGLLGGCSGCSCGVTGSGVTRQGLWCRPALFETCPLWPTAAECRKIRCPPVSWLACSLVLTVCLSVFCLSVCLSVCPCFSLSWDNGGGGDGV